MFVAITIAGIVFFFFFQLVVHLKSLICEVLQMKEIMYDKFSKCTLNGKAIPLVVEHGLFNNVRID